MVHISRFMQEICVVSVCGMRSGLPPEPRTVCNKPKENDSMNLIMSDKPLDVGLLDDATRHVDLSALKIARCVGCFGCWTKTPGRCVIRDDATKVYPLIARSERLLYVSRVKFGSYDSVMKTMLERAIPVQQAFIRIFHGKTHHVQRAVVPKRATILAYGTTDAGEQELFRELVARNARNMNFASYEIRFVAESQLDEAVQNVLEQWKRS